MKIARVAAAASLLLALAACGGSNGKKADTVAEAHWSAGMHAWARGMQDSIDGISVLFGHAASVRGLEAGNPRTTAVLRRYVNVLRGCAARVRELGAAPTRLELARKEGLHACGRLEQAAELIRVGIANLAAGRGMDVLMQSSDPLTDGQDAIRRAILDLTPEG